MGGSCVCGILGHRFWCCGAGFPPVCARTYRCLLPTLVCACASTIAASKGLRELETQHTAEMATLRKEHTSLLGQIENYHRELELAMVATAH